MPYDFHGQVVMPRRRFMCRLASISALAAVPWLTACAPHRPFVVAIHTWIGYETLFLARDLRWVSAGVQFHEGKNASDSMAALQAGQVDAACLTLDEVLRARSNGIPLTVVLVFDVSAGADMLLARPNIRRLADLAGKRIGLEQNALGDLMLSKIMEVAGLAATSLTLVDLPPDRQLEAWRSNRVDAVITYEPVATLLQGEGAQRLFDSRQMPDTIFDVLAVRSDRVKSHQDDLKALIGGHFRALEHLRTNRQDAILRIAAHEGVAPQEIEQGLAGVNLPSLAANRAYLGVGDSRLTRAARTLSTVMVQHGQLPQEDALVSLSTPEWLPHNEG